MQSFENFAYSLLTRSENRFGGKGVIAQVVDDHLMPHDKDGNPFDILLPPSGIISRTNPIQIIETALGKVAAKTGKPYRLPDFVDPQDKVEWALNELRRHGLQDTEDVFDPESGRKIPNVFTGHQFFMKLHHQAESKGQGRGLGGYTMEGAPAKGGATGSKRVGLLDLNALLSHGAVENIRDIKLNRGQANPEHWAQVMSGYRAPPPKVPHVYEKFVHMLKASGINAIPDGPRMHIMALRDQDIDHLAGGRELQNAETVDWRGSLAPIKGGLFDQGLTGGHGGKKWSQITLHEPMPNPVMEDPIRRVLGLTTQQLRDVIAGREKLHGETGPHAVYRALDKLDVPGELQKARTEIAGSKKTARDAAIRRLKFLKSAERLGVHPREWMIHKAPVLPPAFRPVATMGAKKLPLVSDPNYLYQELFDANQNLKHMSGAVEDYGPEREALYDALKGVTGLGDPIRPQNQEKHVKGILKHVFGKSPKTGIMQRKLLSSTTDLVGRSVITPNPDFDMDTVGVPEEKAWNVYAPFVVRNLVRKGFSRVDAARAVKDKTDAAKASLLQELESRPVIVNRAPVLHQVAPTQVAGPSHGVIGNTRITLILDLKELDAVAEGRAFCQAIDRWLAPNAGTALGALATQDGVATLTIPIDQFPRITLISSRQDGARLYHVPVGVSIASYDYSTCVVRPAAIETLLLARDRPCLQLTSARKRTLVVGADTGVPAFDIHSGNMFSVSASYATNAIIPYARRETGFGGEFSKSLGWWYGAFVSDGWFMASGIGYAKREEAKRSAFERIARAEFDAEFSVRPYFDESCSGKLGDSVKLHLSGRGFRDRVFHCLGARGPGRAALYKQLPAELLSRGSRDCLVGLISGLLDGDGTLAWNGSTKNPRPVCRYSTSSQLLAADVVRLCRRLGLRTSVTTTPPRKHSSTAYTICVITVDVAEVVTELMVFGARERSFVSEYLQRSASADNIDLVPITRDLADAFSHKLLHSNWTLYRCFRTACSRHHMLRETAARAIALLPADWHHSQLDGFRRLVAQTDLHWDRLTSVEPTGSSDLFSFGLVEAGPYLLDSGLMVSSG